MSATILATITPVFQIIFGKHIFAVFDIKIQSFDKSFRTGSLGFLKNFFTFFI